MKAYVVTTAIVWVLILGAHAARLFAEGPHLLKEPSFLGSSLLCIGLVVWAGCTLRRRSVQRADGAAERTPTEAAK